VYAFPRVGHYGQTSLAAGNPAFPGLVIAADSARRSALTRGAAGSADDPSQADQRSRLLQTAVELIATSGYPQVRIGDIATAAGVSRATFYEQFRNKEDCFLAAHDQLAGRLIAQTTRALGGRRDSAQNALVSAIVEFANREPLAFSFLTYEAMLAGPDALDRRDRLIAALGEPLEASPGEGRKARCLSIPAWILIGGVVRLLGIRMRREEPTDRALALELSQWIDCYRLPLGTKAAIRLQPHARFLDVGERVSPGLLAPQPLPRGRHRLPGEVVRRIQRERILHATAQVIRAKGYPNTTVADIVAAAGVSREVFYSHFRRRSEAFIDTHQFVFEQMMAATAGTFFAAPGPWPEQVWQSARASTKFLLDAPHFAHFAFVEAYALGTIVARRTDQAVMAFTVLLAGGYDQRPEAAVLPRVVSDAIIAATMETVAFYIRHTRTEELVELLPLIADLVIAPFLGADAAAEFIDGKLDPASS
jgi:AcrR family transcriptional regulator